MKLIKYVITLVFLWPLFFLLKLVPRSNNIWCFSSYRDSFVDNSKYLFHYVSKNHPEISCYWVTDDQKLIKDLTAKGYKVCRRKSLKGALIIIRAKCVFYSSYVSEINFWLTSGAKLINLWHGLPLKKIEFDIDSGVLAQKYSGAFNQVKIFNLLFNPSAFRRADLMFVPNKNMQKIFTSAFRINEESFVYCGSPRTDQFFDKQTFSALHTTKISAPPNTKIYIYMPTFRDTGGDFFCKENFDFSALNQVMLEAGGEFWIKAHPSAVAADLDLNNFERIKLLPSNVDMYPLLKDSYALITDYSSIYIDYLLLNKPIYFYCFDLQHYLKNCRSMYFEYSETTPGVKCHQFNELLAALKDKNTSDNLGYDRVKSIFWADEYVPACKAIVAQIQKRFN